MLPIHSLSFTLSQDELVLLHRSILARLLMENALRKEQGLEAIDSSPLLQKTERLLAISPEHRMEILQHVEDDLWAYSWYHYTDEWAWFRARQDVDRQIKRERVILAEEQREQRIEQRYRDCFDQYVDEVSMSEFPLKKQRTKKAKS